MTPGRGGGDSIPHGSLSGTSLHLGGCGRGDGIRSSRGSSGAPGGVQSGMVTQPPSTQAAALGWVPPFPAAGPLETPSPAWGSPLAPHLLAPGPGRSRLLILGPCAQDFAFLRGRLSLGGRGWGGGRGSPLPRLRCLAPWLGVSLGFAPARAVAWRGLRGAARRGEGAGEGGEAGGAPAGLRSVSPSPRPAGRREALIPPPLALHAAIPPPFMRPSFIHAFLIHSTFTPPATRHSGRTSCVPGGGPGQHGRGGSRPLPSSLPHLADEDGGTGGSQGRGNAHTASSQARAAAGVAGAQGRQKALLSCLPILSAPKPPFLFIPTFPLPRQGREVEAGKGGVKRGSLIQQIFTKLCIRQYAYEGTAATSIGCSMHDLI